MLSKKNYGKNICLYFQSISRAGGAEKKICELSNYLDSIGYKVFLLTLDSNDDKPFYHLNQRIKWLKISKHENHNKFFYKVKKIILIKNILTKYSVDIFVGFVMSGDRSLYLAAILARTKIIVAERNSPQMYKYLFPITTQMGIWIWMHLACRIIIQNKKYLELYPRSLQKKIFVIPNGVLIPVERANPQINGENSRYRILSVQRLDSRQKRPELIINAFQLIADKAKLWDLYLVGEGESDEVERLNKIIISYNLGERIRLIKPSQNIQQYFESSHLFVTATLWEGFPNALAEAMSYGLPVISFGKVIGVSDFVGNGGWLTDNNSSVSELSNIMLEAISAPEERRRRGEIGRENMRNYSTDTHNLLWNKLLEIVKC